MFDPYYTVLLTILINYKSNISCHQNNVHVHVEWVYLDSDSYWWMKHFNESCDTNFDVFRTILNVRTK